MKQTLGKLLLIILLLGCKNKPSTNNYKQGQLLYPNYIHSDTLIVTEAEKLNKILNFIRHGNLDPTNQQLGEILHKYCKMK